MANRKKTVPSYRLHKQSGQAVVTLACKISGKRRDIMLGEYESPESRIAYAEAIAQWERDGRVLDNSPKPEPIRHDETTVAEVMLDWWEGVLKRYAVADPEGRLPSHLYSYRVVVRLVRATCGNLPASRFGPKRLQEVRQAMVDEGWKRSHVNSNAAVIVRAFRQAVAAEVIKPEALVALQCVKPLARGEAGTAEGRKVKPVALADVEAVKPHLGRQIRAIIDVMLLTGSRCGEVCTMRPIDLDTSGKVWSYTPDRHKTEHHGRKRIIHVGPKAQRVIEPFLNRSTHAPLFSPAEAETERREQQHANRVTPMSCGNNPGSNRCAEPARKADDAYTTDVVRRAITRACDEAFPPPGDLARQRVPGNGRKRNSTRWETDKEYNQRLGARWAELKAWRRSHRWTPHQLRHTAGTMIRKEAGIEAAALVLGHSSATLTDAVYAERDTAKAVEVIARVG